MLGVGHTEAASYLTDMGMLMGNKSPVTSYGIKPLLSSASLLGTPVCVQGNTGSAASFLSPESPQFLWRDKDSGRKQ